MPRKELSIRLSQQLAPPQTPQQRGLEVVWQFARALRRIDGPAALADRVGILLASAFDAETGSFFLHDPHRRQLWTPDRLVSDCEGVVGRVFQSHEPKMISRAMILAPVLAGSRCVGVLEVTGPGPRAFQHDDLELLEVLAAQAALALEYVQAIAAERRQFESFARAVAAAVDSRSPGDDDQSLNVANYAVGIGHHLGLDTPDLTLLRVAGLVHDLGKLLIPERILRKTDPLSLFETEELKRHVQYTVQILGHVEFTPALAGVEKAAAMHHERLDGAGYPDALRARDLDLPARVLAVACAFQSLVQDHPNRPGKRVDEALLLLDSMTPHALDARCVLALREFLGQPPRPPSLVAAA